MLSWVYYLISHYGPDIKIILHGVSMGGATVCKMSSAVPKQVKLIISDCAYTSAKDEFQSVANSVNLEKAGPVVIKTIDALNKVFAGYELEETDVRPNVQNAKSSNAICSWWS